MAEETALTEEELACVTAVLMLLESTETISSLKVREAWPSPSPWRWAPIHW
ncbi:MAG: hypothetical protein M1272_00315 [Firmicutes bacterium]|nr:hypothetical protein [Bacillota bacterium]